MSEPSWVAAFVRAEGITAALRENCGWTAELTPQTLAPYLVEEAAEVSETVRVGSLGAPLASELGDVLFQILLHARLAQERGDFELADVAEALNAKLLRRNTHVFAADGSVLEHPNTDPRAAERAWQAAKAAERAARGQDAVDRDPLRGLPASLSGLTLAQKALSRAEPRDSTPPGPAQRDTEELGDELLALVRRARAKGIDAESALRDALHRDLGPVLKD